MTNMVMILTTAVASSGAVLSASHNPSDDRFCAAFLFSEFASQRLLLWRLPVVQLVQRKDSEQVKSVFAGSDDSLTLASCSAVRRAAASEIHLFFSSRKSRSFCCSSTFQSAYLFFADEACCLCSRSSLSSRTTSAR